MRLQSPLPGSARIAVVGADAAALAHLRGGLIRTLTALGHSVRCHAPQADGPAAARLDVLGAELAGFPLEPPGASPFADRAAANALAAMLSAWQPHAVIANGPKATLLGIEAGIRARVGRIVPIVSGLGALELGPAETGSWFARHRRRKRLRSAFAACSAAVFHNGHDIEALRLLGLIPDRLPTRIVAGAGVPLDQFTAQPLPDLSDGFVFLMMARLDRLKGIETFCEAARLLKARAPGTRFVLVGPEGQGTHGLTADYVRSWRDAVTYSGPADDARSALAQAHVVVLPSHVEGMSRTLMEAAAVGRPLIASDIPGCRAAVDERINGCLVPPGDAPALAAAMESFLHRPDLLPAMARASRLKAERRFDERTVVGAELAMILGDDAVPHAAWSSGDPADRAVPRRA